MNERKTKPKKPNGRDVVVAELVGELRNLRAVVREVGENLVLRKEGEIETLISHLAVVPTMQLKREAPGWLHEIKELKLKPAKGRLRDMKRLDVVIEGLAVQIICDQKGNKRSDRD